MERYENGHSQCESAHFYVYDQARDKMVSIAFMIGGAILNATTFVGGSYLARYLSGGSSDAERIRHDKALEKYQKDYEAYQEGRERLADWMDERRQAQDIASSNMESTDEALKYYNRSHKNEQISGVEEPRFADYYSPSSDQKTGEMLYVGGGMLALGYGLSRFI